MKRFFQTAIFIVAVFVCSQIVSAQANCTPPNLFDYDDEQTLTVEANLLLKEPKCYDGQFIRTFGFYRVGFEMSHLFCMNCGDAAQAWVNTSKFAAAIKRCTSPANLKKLESKNEKVWGVVVLGVLNTNLDYDNQNSPKEINSKRMSELAAQGGFGHMNAYDSEFSPICFEQVDILSDNPYVPATADQKTLKRMKKWYAKMSEKLW